jgi:hypothetical protein
VPKPKNPMTGAVDRCAQTVRGQETAAPPINVMKSRRLTKTPSARQLS